MWNRVNPSILKTFRHESPKNEDMRYPDECLEAALESHTERSPFETITRQDPTMAYNPFIFYRSITPNLKHMVRNIAQEESIRIFAERAGASMQKATGEALLNICIVVIQEANTGFKNAPFCFIKDVITEIAAKGYLDYMFERNQETWTQASSLIDDFTQRALNSPHAVRTATLMIRKNKGSFLIYQKEGRNDQQWLRISGISVSLVKVIWQEKIPLTCKAPPCRDKKAVIASKTHQKDREKKHRKSSFVPAKSVSSRSTSNSSDDSLF